jgi:N-acetylneuraminate synthase/N,N'-diacetyllegionaminate synthase
MKIGSHQTDESVFIIAEIGNNHEGDFSLAKEMILLAGQAGANAVKFQTIVPDRLISIKHDERIAQLNQFQFTPEQFRKLRDCANNSGMEFLSTPFDLQSIDWLQGLVPAWKIASGDNNFYPLLERVALTGKPIIISMGLGIHDQSIKLQNFFFQTWKRHGVKNAELAMLHCVVSYPTPDNEAALGQMERLKLPLITLGYSDHTIGIKAAELAVAAGARIIEKHFTIDKTRSGFRDHQLSADPDDMQQLVKSIRDVELMFGNRTGCQVCENSNIETVRRSLTAVSDLHIGELLSMNQFAWLRPGTGISPGQEGLILGKKLKRPIMAGEQISPEDVIITKEQSG